LVELALRVVLVEEERFVETVIANELKILFKVAFEH
jgi:hypothetical protein